MIHFIPLSLLLLGSLAFAPALSAQTCRIRCGVTADGKQIFKDVYEYDFVTEKPTFPGGDTHLICYINENRQYPAAAYRKGITGRVTCSFIVNADGSISHVRVLRGVEPSLNREAVRIFTKMPAWQPGKLESQAVPVRVIRSVTFRR